MINTYNPNDPKGSLHRWRADIKSKHLGDPPDDISDKFKGSLYADPRGLKKWVKSTQSKFIDKGKYLAETSDTASTAVMDMWGKMGYPKDSTFFKEDGKAVDDPVKKNPWSAAYVSNAVMNMFDTDKKGLKKMGFRPDIRHSTYIGDAFKSSKDPGYEYNLYKAQPIEEGSTYDVGDILFSGRGESSKWKYEDFAKAGSKYQSHSAIITDKGKDSKGEYVIVTGGNESNYSLKKAERVDGTETNRSTRVYLKNMKNYKGVLKLNEERKDNPQEVEAIKAGTLESPSVEGHPSESPVEIGRSEEFKKRRLRLYSGGKIRYKAGGKVFIRNPKKLKKTDSEKKKLRKKYGRKNVKVTKGRAPNPTKWKTYSNKSGSKKPKNVKPTDKGHVKKRYNREILSLRMGAKPKRTNKSMQNA